MKKREFFKSRKKKLALLLAMTVTATTVGNISFGNNRDKVYAGETETVVFAQGYGTGKDFSSSSWTFAGQAMYSSGPEAGETYSISSTDANGPKIVANNYGAGEDIIRLINGVVAGNNGIEASTSYQDYRSGEA